MFDQLDGAMSGLEIPPDGASLAAVIRIRDRLDAKIALAVGSFERSGLWEIEGSTSMVAWLRDRGGVARRQVSEEPVRSLHHSCTLDNRWEGTWSLDAEGGALVQTAIGLATTKDLDGDPIRTAAQKRADAMVDICREFLAHQNGRPAGVRTRPHIGLLIDPDAQGHPGSARIIDGPVLSDTTVQRLLCDCAYQRIVMAGGSVVIDLGRTTRSISVAMWRTLVASDQHCRFPGCDRPPRWCQAHHVHPWETGGPTDQSNLVLLCSRHHHLIHLPGWHTKLQPDDATLTVTFPDRAVRTSQPPGRLRLNLDPPRVMA